MNLYLLILFPFLTAILILLMPSRMAVRTVALSGSVVQVLLSFFLYFAYQSARQAGQTTQMLFESRQDWFSAWHIQYHFGVDGISIAMILLTSLVVIAGVLVSWNMEKMTKEYFFLLMLLSFGAYGFFISLDMMVMFFFLEVAVIPKYLLIGIWGSGKKEYSANKLALMLMGGSALVLVGMLILYFQAPLPTFDILEIAKIQFPIEVQRLVFPLLFIGFGVFTALFPFHTWVPDGHSSAPTAGSMFLAGISMKLGGYGCLRLATYLMPEGALMYSDMVIILSTIAIFYGSFVTLMQKDLKYLNAYSSVSHCGFVLLGIGMLSRIAFTGAVMQMVSHGLMTALFFAVIGMIYERTHTRQVDEMGGLLSKIPFISTVLFIVGFCSLGLPGLSGFAAEMTVFVGSWQRTEWLPRTATVLSILSIVVTAVYILRAIGKVAMGTLPARDAEIQDATWNEKLVILVLLAGILLIGLAPFLLSDLVSPDTLLIIKRFSTLK